MAGGAVVCLLIVRARIRIRNLLELTVACGLAAVFWALYSEAMARHESWNDFFNSCLPTMYNTLRSIMVS
jgi:hypothetical protein